jgi:hypothetical protein
VGALFFGCLLSPRVRIGREASIRGRFASAMRTAQATSTTLDVASPSLRAGREALCCALCAAVLPADDPFVADREHLVDRLLRLAVLVDPVRGRDDLVSYFGDVNRLDPEATVRSSLALEVENLTGLVGAVSGGCPFPPEVSARRSPPFKVIVQERNQGRGVALVEGGGGLTQALAQLGSHAGSLPAAPGTGYLEGSSASLTHYWLQRASQPVGPTWVGSRRARRSCCVRS